MSSLQIKKGKYYAVIDFKDKEGKRKQKWISTGLDAKNNKRKAEQGIYVFTTCAILAPAC